MYDDPAKLELSKLSDDELIRLVKDDRDNHDPARVAMAELILTERDYEIRAENDELTEVSNEKPQSGKFFGTWKSLLVLSGLGFLRVMLKGTEGGMGQFTLVLSIITFCMAIYLMSKE